MAYQMAATVVTLNDLEGHSQVAGLFKCNPSNICAAFYTLSTDNVLTRSLCVSGASSIHWSWALSTMVSWKLAQTLTTHSFSSGRILASCI